MVSVRKRPLHVAVDLPQVDQSKPSPQLPPELLRLRNSWQFACLYQWLFIFGGLIKTDIPDIDELEVQCLSHHSTVLQDIGLALLKYLSSHRGLTHDLFDEYTKRQFSAKAPGMTNPFGTDEIPAKFSEFSVLQKVRILHQMTLFVMMNPEKVREKMAEQKDADHDQTTWRIEPFGWDRNDRAYYVLDDNRVYRMTETPSVPVKPKKNTKKARAEARRSNKRRRISTTTADDSAEDSDTAQGATALALGNGNEDGDDGLGGMKWECVAVSLSDLRALLSVLTGKGDANERILREKICEHLLPILEQQEERRTKREKERERELFNLAKMATAKRSSRIASRQEQQKQEEAQREEEMKRRRELEVRRKEEQKLRRLERERDNRLLSRENRLRERELRRTQYEEELAQLSEDSRNPDISAGRLSERRRIAEIERNKEALKELDLKMEEEWVFDCICGLYGKVDDGQHSVSCERCSIWQHSKCLGIDEQEAEKEDFHFVCESCRRRMHEGVDSQSSHPSPRLPVIRIKASKPVVELPSLPPVVLLSPQAGQPPTTSRSIVDIPMLPVGDKALNINAAAGADAGRGTVFQTAPTKADGLSTSRTMLPPGDQRAIQNGRHQSLATPHIDLPLPDQSPRKVLAYSAILEQAPLSPPSRAAGQSPPMPTVPNKQTVLPPTPVAAARLALLANSHIRPADPNATEFPSPPQTAAAACATAPAFPSQTPAPALTQTPAQASRQPPPTPTSFVSVGELLLEPRQRAASSFATPRLQHPIDENQAVALREQTASPLLLSRGGLSPTKHSPTATPDPIRAFSDSDPAPPIMPPAAALSPSAPKQNLTPPVKHEAPAHRPDATSSPVVEK